MKFKKLPLFVLFCLLLTTTNSCNNESLEEEEEVENDTDLYRESANIDEANSSFSFILAKAIVNEDIREFIKEQALQQVDNDYDVIYQLVKNKRLKNGLTFRENLAKYTDDANYLDDITKHDPRLSILVPYIDSSFNAEAWDIKSQIPMVALRNFKIKKDETKLLSYQNTGDVFYINRYENPQMPMLVVKSNERLVSAANNNLKSTVSEKNAITNDEGIFAYFIDETFNNTKPKAKMTGATMVGYLSRLKRHNAYIYAYYNNVDPRDYVYFQIDPKSNIKNGYFRSNYAEHLTHLEFNTPSAYDAVSERGGWPITGDWSDGGLEIYIDFIFTKKDGGATSLRKIIHIPINELFETSNGTVNPATKTKNYELPEPLEIFVWNLAQYGDTYKVSIFEYDDGTQTTITQTVASTYSTNIEENSSGLLKLGAKNGSSTTITKTSTTSITRTNNSDQLGEFYVNFFDPVMSTSLGYIRIYKKPAFGASQTIANFNRDNSTYQSYENSRIQWEPEARIKASIYNYKDYNTGTISARIIPLKIQ